MDLFINFSMLLEILLSDLKKPSIKKPSIKKPSSKIYLEKKNFLLQPPYKRALSFRGRWINDDHVVLYFVSSRGLESQAVLSLWNYKNVSDFATAYHLFLQLSKPRRNNKNEFEQILWFLKGQNNIDKVRITNSNQGKTIYIRYPTDKSLNFYLIWQNNSHFLIYFEYKSGRLSQPLGSLHSKEDAGKFMIAYFLFIKNRANRAKPIDSPSPGVNKNRCHVKPVSNLDY